MMLLGQWAVLLVVVSGLLWLLSTGVAKWSTSFSDWPAYWSTMLVLSLVIPALTFLLSAFPNANLAQHMPLPEITLLEAPRAMQMSAFEGDASTTPMGEIALVLIGACYLAGLLVCLIGLTIGRLRVASIVRQARPLHTADENHVLISDQAATAFTCTFGWPRRSWIVIPSSYLQHMASQLIHSVIQHEQAHLDRSDDAWGLCYRTIIAVCWPSPWIRAFFRGWVLSTELHCDQAVTWRQPLHLRRAYARSIVQAHGIAANRVVVYPAASFSPQQPGSESMRIKHILSGKTVQIKNQRQLCQLALVAAMTATSLSMACAVYAGPQLENGITEKPSPFARWLPGRVTSEFGTTRIAANGTKTHKGIDISAPTGTPILAPDDATVVIATDLYNNMPAYGKVVVLETADQTRTLLAHLDEYQVVAGQVVEKGTPIASVGNTGQTTGPHAHIETWRNDKRVNPRHVW